MTKPAQKLVRFDWAMKNILRDKANFDVLEGFLTSLLEEEITILEILESESNQDREDGKSNRVDLKCKDSSGRQIIIEVQSERKADYFERIVWGTSKAVVESMKRGDDYLEIAKVISVSILFHDLNYPKQNRDYLYYGKTDITGRHYDEKLQIMHGITKECVTSGDIFPEYYVICVNKFNDEIHDMVDEWVYLFKHAATRAGFSSPGINAAEAKLDYLGMSKEERARYDADLDAASNAASEIATALLDGEAIGIEKGKMIGIEKGKAIGIEEEKLATARKMLAMDLSLDVIEQATGIPAAELRKLRKEK